MSVFSNLVSVSVPPQTDEMAAEQASSPFVALLESTQVSELVTPDREIIFVDSTQSPKDAFQVRAELHLSCPGHARN